MSYYISAKLQASFDDAIARTEAALKTEGFGVISRIDIQQTLNSKINVDFRPYTILGACNPSLAHAHCTKYRFSAFRGVRPIGPLVLM